jgi:hypothetical protein
MALRELLQPTSLPPELVEEVLSDTNTLWRLGVSDELVAAELVLCHPPLRPEELRAVVNQAEEPNVWRATVVARDRPGLLATSSAVLAGAGLSIIAASVTVLTQSGLALQRLTVAAGERVATDEIDWDGLAAALRAGISGGELPQVAFTPHQPVVVEVQPQDLGRSVVTVEAPDSFGLFHVAAAWFEAAGCHVDACRAGTENGRAHDAFIVTGPVDPAALAAVLGGQPAGSTVTMVVTTPMRLAGHAVGRLGRAAHGFLATAVAMAWTRRRGQQP